MNPCRRPHSFAFPYSLRPALLVVLDGVPGSGRSTQLARLREGQERSTMFSPDPLFVELPEDLESEEGVRLRTRAEQALTHGRPVFAERWHPADRTPDLVLLSLHSWADQTRSRPAPPDLPAHVVLAPTAWESLVTQELMDELFGRQLLATCPCQVAA